MENNTDDKSTLKEEIYSNDYYFSEQQLGIDNRTKRLVMNQIMPCIKGPKVLELGFVDGMITDLLLSHGVDVIILEGAAKHIEYARKKYHGHHRVSIIHGNFEEFVTADKYDTILAGDMLQYLEDPIVFFSKAKEWLADAGLLIVTTPNRRSFHRRIGAYMGVLNNPEEVGAHDKATGNKKMYDAYELKYVLEKSGLKVDSVRGCFLKPLSSEQLKNWDDKLMEAFLKIGEELGDYCWFLTALATK